MPNDNNFWWPWNRLRNPEMPIDLVDFSNREIRDLVKKFVITSRCYSISKHGVDDTYAGSRLWRDDRRLRGIIESLSSITGNAVPNRWIPRELTLVPDDLIFEIHDEMPWTIDRLRLMKPKALKLAKSYCTNCFLPLFSGSPRLCGNCNTMGVENEIISESVPENGEQVQTVRQSGSQEEDGTVDDGYPLPGDDFPF